MDMETVFLKLLNMSINGGWLILAVIALRFLLKKAPAWITCLLWALVAVRLICPFSLESVFSLMPSRESIPREIALSPMPSVSNGVPFADSTVNPVLRNSFAPTPAESANPLQIWLFVAGILWFTGACALLLYAAVGYIRLYLKIRTALRFQGSVYKSEFIDTPFLFGLVRPRIYLPSCMPEEMYEPVIAHEQAHLARLDHLWKMLGYVLLTVYWFHPLCWAAYILFCRDLELACDEKVIGDYDTHQKKAYSEALLACSLRQHNLNLCPLAFGEVNVKKRIRSVLHYKKPRVWVMSAAILVCAAAAVCFLTDPAESPEPSGENPSAASGNTNILSGIPESGNSANGETESGGSGTDGQDLLFDDSGTDDQDLLSNDSDTDDYDHNTLESGQTPADNPSAYELFVRQWAQAFISRSGNQIAAMASREVISDLEDRELLSGPENQRSFGQSSPWPVDTEADLSICSVGSGQAEILYYAWTSEPHVTVWRETLSYEQRDGKYLVTGEELLYLDDISSLEAFTLAYGSPTALDNSRMNYLSTGAWEPLTQNALLSSTTTYLDLFFPESAARILLNLSKDPDKVKVEELVKEDDFISMQILFAGEPAAIQISMIRPFGSAVWIPADYRLSPLYRLSLLNWKEIETHRLSGPENPDWSDVIRMAYIPDRNITIYGYNDTECSGQGVAVDVDGHINLYDWIYTSPHCVLPEFYWDEKREQLQAKLHIYTGTGASADSLHVLQLGADGAMTDNALELNTFSDMLMERIQYVYEKENGLLTLLDRSTRKELTTVAIEDTQTVTPELGMISEFLPGETIYLRVTPGYFLDASPIAEYDFPPLEAEILLEPSDGRLIFSLGEIRTAEDS